MRFLGATTLTAECTRTIACRESAVSRCETLPDKTVVVIVDYGFRRAARRFLLNVGALRVSRTSGNRQHPRACCSRANRHGSRSRHRPKRPNIRQCFADPGDSQTMEKWHVQPTEDRRV